MKGSKFMVAEQWRKVWWTGFIAGGFSPSTDPSWGLSIPFGLLGPNLVLLVRSTRPLQLAWCIFCLQAVHGIWHVHIECSLRFMVLLCKLGNGCRGTLSLMAFVFVEVFMWASSLVALRGERHPGWYSYSCAPIRRALAAVLLGVLLVGWLCCFGRWMAWYLEFRGSVLTLTPSGPFALGTAVFWGFSETLWYLVGFALLFGWRGTMYLEAIAVSL